MDTLVYPQARRFPLQAEQHRSPSIAPLVRATYAVVLAGGRGTRLHQLTDWRAKPAVPFGGKHRIVDFALSNCVNSGVRRIGVMTQYKAHSLIQHIRRGWSFLDADLHEFIDLLPAQQRIQDQWYQGTADAVYQNLDIISMESPQYILVLAGDHVYKMDYGVMIAEHAAAGADVSVACIEVPLEQASSFGVMQVDERDIITQFCEKPARPAPLRGSPDKALASMGIYLFNADFLYRLLREDASRTDSSRDFGHDILPSLVERTRVHAHRYSRSCVNMVNGAPYWRDVGTIDAYWSANIDLTTVIPELDLYDERWPIRTFQEQLPPAKFVFDDDHARGHAMDSLISGGCIVSGATVRRSLLSTSVVIERHSSIEDSVILPKVKIGKYVALRRVVIDKFCCIPDGFTAGFDLAADARRFHVTSQGTVLITPEMLGQRIHEAAWSSEVVPAATENTANIPLAHAAFSANELRSQ
ncbi:MAG: glucose-1-phosphate adenylyltransferase [Candidatus Obscuribacterales bacterium]|nr:glucose-1-phosphate adenylyltransferase [Steroidobacteraceae bacterium]